jgi:predicted N-formylglutamate amidohydrolase
MPKAEAMKAVHSHWPPAVESLNAAGRSPLVLLCQHASNYIPSEYHDLGLDAPQLISHVAWDIGAAGVTRKLSAMLDAPAFLGTYSRLLIDLNRVPNTASSIVTRSEATDIPGNRSLSTAERERRLERIFSPYHNVVQMHLGQRAATGRPTVIVAVHSFTPVYHGVPREWHAGVLFAGAVAFGNATLERLSSRAAGLRIGANGPYDISLDTDYGVLVYGDNASVPALVIEIRQDLVTSVEGQQEWAELLAHTLAFDVALGMPAR